MLAGEGETAPIAQLWCNAEWHVDTHDTGTHISGKRSGYQACGLAQDAPPDEVADGKGNRAPSREDWRRGLEAEEIGDFDENLAAIIQESIGNVKEVAVRILTEGGIKILQVAVVTKVDSGARMEKIGEEQVGVEVFGRLEGSEIRVSKDCRILTDKAKREFASELVVAFRADDVIVEDAGTPVEATKAGQQVRVLHGEFSRGTHGEIDLRIAGICEEGTAKQRRCGGSVEVGVRAPTNLAVQGDLLEEARLKEETRMMMSIVAVARESAEVKGAKTLMAEIAEEAEKCLALKQETVIGVGKPLQTRALVVPVVDGEEARAVPDEMLAFRTKAVESELAEPANVGAAKETRLGLETL